MVEYVVNEIDDILIVKIEIIRATLSNASAFKKTIDELIEQGYAKFIVDCRSVEFMDSTFLGSLVMTLKKLDSLSGDLRLVFAKKDSPIWLMFETTRMIKVFKSFLSLDEALESFNTSK